MEKTIRDTTSVKIIPVDLYSIIYSTKEAQFAKHGRNYDADYEEKMLALLEEKPQQLLQNDRIAREVIRAILSSDNNWINVLGGREKESYCGTYKAMLFSDVSEKGIEKRLFDLKNDCGLLDSVSTWCSDPGVWCFESEILYGMDKTEIFGGGRPNFEGRAIFRANQNLRDALRKMLKPFESEKKAYILHPGEESHPQGVNYK